MMIMILLLRIIPNKSHSLILKTIENNTLSKIMKTKTGRFNYLANREGSLEAKLDTDRFQYKQIISQLTKQHQPKDPKEIFAYDNAPRRTYSPIGNVLQLRPDPTNRQVRSIILNEAIVPKKNQEPKLSKRETYCIIKDAHLISDQELETFCEQNESPPKVYYSPFKQQRLTPEKQLQTTFKFYQIRNEPAFQERRRTNMQKSNQPYINQVQTQTYALQVEKIPQNPQNKRVTPTKVSQISESRIAKSNKAYKMEKSQQRIVYRQQQARPHAYKPYQNNFKRSCYDYVPEQMKARLKERHFEN